MAHTHYTVWMKMKFDRPTATAKIHTKTRTMQINKHISLALLPNEQRIRTEPNQTKSILSLWFGVTISGRSA